MFQYLMGVRSELYEIMALGSHIRRDSEDCKNKVAGKFCWTPNSRLLETYTEKWIGQLLEFDKQILNTRVYGGLGIGHLTAKDNFMNDGGVREEGGLKLGYCFDCDASCKNFAEPNPSGATFDISNNQFCNKDAFTYTWEYLYETTECAYFDHWNNYCAYWYAKTNHASASMNIPSNVRGYACCSCSCMEESKYSAFAGTADAHRTYNRHCPARDEIITVRRNNVI